MPIISFQPVILTNTPLLYKWLQSPLVSKRYDDGILLSYEQYYQKIKHKIDSPYEFPYLILLDDSPIGYIQCYDCRWADKTHRETDVSNGTRGIDMFIGEDQWRGKGLWWVILKQFVDTIVIAIHHAKQVMIDPDILNIPATKAYQKAWFSIQKTIESKEWWQEYIMMYQSQ